MTAEKVEVLPEGGAQFGHYLILVIFLFIHQCNDSVEVAQLLLQLHILELQQTEKHLKKILYTFQQIRHGNFDMTTTDRRGVTIFSIFLIRLRAVPEAKAYVERYTYCYINETAGQLIKDRNLVKINGTDWVTFESAKNHERKRRKRQSVTAKREKSQTPKFV